MKDWGLHHWEYEDSELSDRDCVWCYKRFENVEMCNEHRKECCEENEIKLSANDIFSLIDNPKNY
jgi:hypothetical protein